MSLWDWVRPESTTWRAKYAKTIIDIVDKGYVKGLSKEEADQL